MRKLDNPSRPVLQIRSKVEASGVEQILEGLKKEAEY